MELPSYRWRFVHLAALWGYGVSQPVFSMLTGNPEFLVVRGSTRADVVVFALALAFVPPLVVVSVEMLAALVSRALSGALHVVAIWGFAFLAVLQLTRLLDVERGAALLLPMLPALLVAFLYLKLRGFRSFLSLSFVLPILGVLAFVAAVPLATDDAAAADVRVAHPVPVVLVVFDEFPVSSIMRADGSIDAVRYPNFGRLAREATWYPHATAVHESTTQAVPAILTGIEPRHGQLPTLADHPHNLFTLLGAGFAAHASEQVTRLCPSRYCPQTVAAPPILDRQRGLFYDVAVGYLHRILPDALAGELPPIGERWGNFADGSDPDTRVVGALDIAAWRSLAIDTLNEVSPSTQFLSFLRTLRRPQGRPSLFFEHALPPHRPWRFLPSGREYPSAQTVVGLVDNGRRWVSSGDLVETALQRHLLQVGYVDHLLGLMLARLQQIGLYDRALVIVTADHGASFQPGGLMRRALRVNLADIAGVPLLVKYPGQRRGRVDGRDAKTIDIVPTIADVVGVRIPWHVDGVSLRRAAVSRPVSVSKSEGNAVVAAPAKVAAGVLATARRNTAVFGEGTDSIYRRGLYPELLNRPLASISTLGSARDDVHFDNPAEFAHVNLSSGIVPARITGSISGDALPVGSPLAIVVNHDVRAVARSYDLGRQSRFVTLVPETAFHNGQNIVEIYSVSRSHGAFRLLRLGGTPRQAEAPVAANAVSAQGPEAP
jgi:hypothetical protein